MKETRRMEVSMIIFLFVLLSGNYSVMGDDTVSQNCPYVSEAKFENKDDLVLKVIATMIEFLQPIVVQAVENKLKDLDVFQIGAKIEKLIQKEEETDKYVEHLFDNMSKKMLEIELQQLRDSNKLEKITSSLSETTNIILSDMKENAERLEEKTSKTLRDFLKETKAQLRGMEDNLSQEMETAIKNFQEVNDKVTEIREEAKNTKTDLLRIIENVQQKAELEIIPTVAEFSKLFSHVNESITSAKSEWDENQKEISSTVNSLVIEVKEVATKMGNIKQDVMDTGNNLQAMESKLSTAVAIVGENIVTAMTKAESEIGIKLSGIASEHKDDTKNFIKESCIQKPMPVSYNCGDILRSGQNVSGIYSVMVSSAPLQVYCDMDTDGGGWTVIQRRDDVIPHVEFYLDWADYKRGFGDDLSKEFWLGLDAIHALTSRQSMSLRVDLEDFDGNKKFAFYRWFSIGNEANKYRLSLEVYQGDAGDALMYHHNGHAFSTKDRDNDGSDVHHCAQLLHGGWWYGACHWSNLNGQYIRGKHKSLYQGVSWHHMTGNYDSLKKSEMKIRPINF